MFIEGAREMRWRKSTRSGDTSDCVEVAFTSGNVHLRDSKDPCGPTLVITNADWAAFTGTKVGNR
ncbi:hypothetical protein Lfu02_49830 [Longispora fulva]|uniref:DUF397 domain-containing protein n=2 Tax=Longispora fulva TaxID=619741 RepID=A0A8J7GTV2_9ACTN|nr:DUF397 domain-containing protein [Longispora fulva]MBG6138359.1 hypothetical protein [Longispora fulva]GIG60611.1 hypothetical protein Lfu02_49830 [Longispora fulva]